MFYIQHSTQRHQASSVLFSGWKPLEWHQDTFLSNASVSEKEAWLEALIQSGDKRIDLVAFLLVLNSLSVSPDASAPRRAEQWMKRLKDFRSSVEPSIAAYVAVIRAWANSAKEEPTVVVNRAERWLNEVILMNEARRPESESSLQPTIELFNAFLDACTRGRPGRNKRSQWAIQSHAKKADALLRKLHSNFHHNPSASTVAPTTESFNYVLRGWTRCHPEQMVTQKVMGLLRMMEASQRDDPQGSLICPNTKSYSLAMDGLVRVAKSKAQSCYEASDRRNEDTSFNGIDELHEAEAILKYMHRLHDAGVKGVVPHRVPYNILLTGWSALAKWNHVDAAFRAEEILRTMLTQRENNFREISPDRISYEKVMLAWANVCQPNSGQRARWWLQQLCNESELQGDRNLLPSVHTYNIAIGALAMVEGAAAAESLLLDLGDKYRKESDKSLCPNSESFALVIQAWLRQAHTEKHADDKFQALSRAVEWLSSLREIENENKLSTTPEQYVRVLQAAKECARERPIALDIAEDVFEAMRKSRHGLDVFAYASLLEVGLEALSSLEHEKSRTEFVQGLFDKCREDGMVGKHFVQAIAGSHTYTEGWTIDVREELMKRIFHTWPFPPSWTRNIRSSSFLATRIHFDRSGGFGGPPVMNEERAYDDDELEDNC